jgi:para-nitrobenzyl esterase
MIFLFSVIISSCYETSDNNSTLPILAAEIGSSGTGGATGGTAGPGPIRTTQYGAVQGTADEENTWTWLGIPYAKPPVGGLRWRAPQNPDSWSGTRKAEAFCSICPQYGNQITETGRDTFVSIWGKGVPVGSEDCLYLNIWRPQTDEKLPVFVFIHGGANYIGATNVSIYRGARLASRQKLVVVTISYRLGPFGWFTLPALKTGNPLDDSGNYGTLDIIKALEWIKNNISSFGGDPGNVTISGQSAGGWNVTSMLVSPLAKGLFHRAIIMSGWPFSLPTSLGEACADAVLYRFLVRDNLADNVIEAASLLNEKGKAWTASYLRSKTVTDFFPPGLSGPLGMSLDGGPLASFRSGIFEDGTVIPKSVLSCLSSGDYHKVPVILGCMTEEMKLFIPYFLINPGTMWDAFQLYDPDNPEATFKLKDMLDPILWILLPGYEPLGKAGQILFQTFGVDNTAKILRKHQSQVYAYKFAWNDEPYPFDFFLGAAHAMDIPFVFGNFIRDKSSLVSFAWSSQNMGGCEQISDAMMTYYAQFARTGNPNKPGSPLPQWTPWSNDTGANKRIVFDTGAIYMSDDYAEPSEALNVQDILAEIIKLISN